MTCHCFIRHAITEDERKVAANRLEEARRLSDFNGMIISMAMLSNSCPAREKNDKGKSEDW
jgi:hypothetical protein